MKNEKLAANRGTTVMRIKKGPKKEDFFRSLSDGHDKSSSGVYFITEDGLCFYGDISSIEREDSSGNGYNFTGYFNDMYLSGYYHTDKRKGTIVVKSPFPRH